MKRLYEMYRHLTSRLRTINRGFNKPNNNGSVSNIDKYHPDDENLIADTKAAFLAKPTTFSSVFLVVIIFLVLSGLIWSYFGMVDQSTVGEGVVITVSEDKKIQSMDGGTIRKILVREGDIVKSGQVVIDFDVTRYQAQYHASYEKYLSLSATAARLLAESEHKDSIQFPKEVELDRPELVSLETNLFSARKAALKIELDNLQKIIELSNKEIEMYKPLLKQRYISELQYLRAVRVAATVQQDYIEKKHKFEEEVLASLNEHRSQIEVLRNEMITLKDKITRARVRSPVYGMVKKVYVTTEGEVVSPGMNMMDIVPLSDSLLVQVKVSPRDIAFIHNGLPATVKLTAYDFAVYGSLEGEVIYVSPNIIEDKSLLINQPDKTPYYYLVNIKTKKSYFGNERHKLPIIPGMTAIAQIKTGKKRIIDYLLKPIVKAKEEALRER